MRIVRGMALALAFLGVDLLAAQDRMNDLEKLVGSWNIVSIDKGKGAKETPGFKLSISDKKIVVRASNGTAKKMVDISRVDVAVKPQIDLKNGTETGLGIYELSGDDLKLLVRDPGQERAKEFKGTPQGILFTLKREKR